MEERVGQWWHQAISRLARLDHPEAAVSLDEVKKSIGILFRSAGGSLTLRLTQASEQRVGGQATWLQRISGSGSRAATAQLEPDVLALPAQLAVFASTDLNRDLYLWLALQSAFFADTGDWLFDNQDATREALCAFPGFIQRHDALLKAHLAQRPDVTRMRGPTRLAEQWVQSHLCGQDTAEHPVDVGPQDVAPV